jgi:hypothetical protein
MPTSEDDLQALVLLKTGDVDPATGKAPDPVSKGIVYRNLDLLWDQWAAKDLIVGGLRALYVERDGLELIIAVLGPRRIDAANSASGLDIKASQVTGMYERKLARVQAAINRTEAAAASAGRAGGYRIGKLRNQAPVVPSSPPDANDPRYAGTPYVGRDPRST